eukprot:scaffold141761_cov17-Prasinocladus_malaysianus.AAC.2
MTNSSLKCFLIDVIQRLTEHRLATRSTITTYQPKPSSGDKIDARTRLKVDGEEAVEWKSITVFQFGNVYPDTTSNAQSLHWGMQSGTGGSTQQTMSMFS